jgi:hypothetical protein
LSDIDLRPGQIEELFAVPEGIVAIMARPAKERSQRDHQTVAAWLMEPQRREFLLMRALGALVGEFGADRIKWAAAIVDVFYTRRIDDIVRKARPATLGSVLLIAFDNDLRRTVAGLVEERTYVLYSAARQLEVRALREIAPIHGIPALSITVPRLSAADRLLRAWAPNPHPETDDSIEAPEGEWVETTVFGPRKVQQGRHFMVQTYVHVPEQAAEAALLALAFDEKAKRLGVKALSVRLLPDTPLTFRLHIPGLSVVRPHQELVWRRQTAYVSFGIDVPPNHPVGDAIGTLRVFVDVVPVGEIAFKVEVTRASRSALFKMDALDPVVERIQRYTLAFISSASQDRPIVLKMVQMLRFQQIKFFMDVIDLEPGQRWELELFRHIDECDLFLLFWSSQAKASQWVIKEAVYALERQGGNGNALPHFEPIMLEGPPPVPPPPELAHLHFDDPLTYFTPR